MPSVGQHRLAQGVSAIEWCLVDHGERNGAFALDTLRDERRREDGAAAPIVTRAQQPDHRARG